MKIIDKKYKMMNTNKIIVGYLAVVISLCMLLPLKAVSQGYAGPNKIILKDSSVVIGGSGCSSCCYLWTPATGLSDPKILHPTAKPTSTTTYTLKVTGDNFNINDVSQMTVTVKDGLDGLTVVPKQCCWGKGDPIKLDQFTITTDPPGLEGTVTLSPTTVPGNVFLGLPVANAVASLPVTFTARGANNTTKTAVVTISGVDEDAQTQFQVGMGEIKVEDIIAGVDQIINNVANVGGCQVTGGFSASMSFATGKLCCADAACIKPMFAYTGTIGYDKGVACDFILYGIPYAASINARVSASAGISVNLGNIKTTCDGVDVCFAVGLSASLGGGFSATVGGGRILDMSLMLVGNISTPPLEYCVMKGLTERKANICLKADAVGSITFLGYITESISISVINQRCW
ncbi:MAG: hypothetical protein ACOYOV_01720 [Bacteroidales bacterium]